MMYSVMALDVLGYAKDDPVRVEALRQFNSLMVDDGERFFFQPCFSPVWDTAIAAYALAQSDAGPSDALRRAADWLLAQGDPPQGRLGREASRTPSPPAGPSNTPTILSGYRRHGHGAAGLGEAAGGRCRGAARPATRRALNWLLAMQSKDGGWAAFDADNNWEFLSHVPFADHNAMLDPTCADITGRVLEALAAHGLRPRSSRPCAAASSGWCAIRSRTEAGTAAGAWLTFTAPASRCAACAAAGESDREAHVLRAGEWLRSIQNADGGWGESCASYDNGIVHAGPSTPSQTAWAILGLIAGGDADSLSVQHGIEYLARDAAPRWKLGRGTGHGHRLSQGLLPELPHVQGLLPAARTGVVCEGRGRSERIAYEISASR